MKQVPFKLGPLALLLSVISICLTTLAILSFATSSADLRLAQKYAETMKIRYELEQEGQDFLRSVKEGNTAGAEQDADGSLSRVFTSDGFELRVRLTEDGQVLSWRIQKQWEEDTEIEIWPGF